MKKTTISLILSSILLTYTYASDELEAVVVTAKSAQSAIDTAGSYTIITQYDIKSMNATSINDVLREKAGISSGVNSGSQYGRSTINLRGMDSKHTLIMIDGKRISSSDALIGLSDFSYSWIPLNSIEKIEVVRGPMSSLYGSSALGGVINIITKKLEEPFYAEVETKQGISSANNEREQDYSIGIGGKITKNLSASFFGQIIDNEPIKNGLDTLSRIEGKEVKNGIFNVWYDIDSTQQIALFSVVGNEIRDNLRFDKYYDIDKNQNSIEYKKIFDGVKMSLKYYTTSLDAHAGDTTLLYTHKMDDEVANAEFAISFIPNNYLVIGAEKRKEEYKKIYDLTPTKNFKNEIDYTSLYLQDEISIRNDLLLTLGARYDKHESFGAEFSPKAYLVYKLDEANRVKGGYGHGFNAPSLTQNANDYVFSYPIRTTPPILFYRFHGNENLKPETSDSYEFGYEYTTKEQSIKGTIFYTKIKDLVTFKDNGTTVTGPITYEEKLYSNVNEATVYGFELEYEQKNLFSIFDLYTGYTYLNSEDKATGDELIYRPKHKVDLKFTSKLPYGIDGVLRVSYIGEQYNDSANKLDPYITSGFSLSKEIINKLNLTLGVDNFTNKQLDEEYEMNMKNRVVYTRLNYKF